MAKIRVVRIVRGSHHLVRGSVERQAIYISNWQIGRILPTLHASSANEQALSAAHPKIPIIVHSDRRDLAECVRFRYL